jgi:HAD superfamily hydrolase (TIGR01509 family)
MKYKALLLDIDDTLYCYDSAHSVANKSVIDFFKNELNIDETTVISTYKKARKKTHIDLSETAASHNRLLYFQKMCESLEVNPLKNGIKLYNLYWDIYLENLQPFDGVYDLLKKYNQNICFVTDLTAHIQYRKIEKLKFYDYSKIIVTSEESGKEKPHPYIFIKALQKLDKNPYEVCMIGDNFKKDIIGANNLGIDSIWFNHKEKQSNYQDISIKEANIFREILELV